MMSAYLNSTLVNIKTYKYLAALFLKHRWAELEQMHGNLLKKL
jgi:hypothetical protein